MSVWFCGVCRWCLFGCMVFVSCICTNVVTQPYKRHCIPFVCNVVCKAVWQRLYRCVISFVWLCDIVCVAVWNVCIDVWYHLYGSATLLGCATVSRTLYNSPKQNEAKSVCAEWTNRGSSLTLERRTSQEHNIKDPNRPQYFILTRHASKY